MNSHASLDADSTAREAKDAEDLQEIEILLSARVYLFTLFHKAFGGEPTSELLEVLGSAATIKALDPYVSNGTLGSLRAFLPEVAAKAHDESYLWDIEAEYARALVGPGVLPAVPWESPYKSHESAFMQEGTLEVRKLYRRCGLEPLACQHVPDDHVSLLCAFAAVRSKRALESFRASDGEALRSLIEEQCVFARDHLASWLGRYAAKMCSMKTACLYPQMAKGLAAFARQDETFCAHLMLWLDEGLEDGGTALSSCLPACGIEQADLGRLENLRLQGLEENELVAIDRG